MKFIKYEEFAREKKEKFFSLRAQLGRKRGVRRRKRDLQERKALMIMDKKRRQRWISEGTLQVISPRYYILRLDPQDFDPSDAM